LHAELPLLTSGNILESLREEAEAALAGVLIAAEVVDLTSVMVSPSPGPSFLEEVGVMVFLRSDPSLVEEVDLTGVIVSPSPDPSFLKEVGVMILLRSGPSLIKVVDLTGVMVSPSPGPSLNEEVGVMVSLSSGHSGSLIEESNLTGVMVSPSPDPSLIKDPPTDTVSSPSVHSSCRSASDATTKLVISSNSVTQPVSQ